MLPQIIECDKQGIIVINQQLQKIVDNINTHELAIQKVFIAGETYDLISKNVSIRSIPKFTSISELQSGRKSPQYIFKGSSDSQTGELLIGIQIERINSGDMYSGQYYGFNSTDENYLSFLCLLLSPKIKELAIKKQFKLTTEQNLLLPKTVYGILKTRTIPEILNEIHGTLPHVLGFDYCDAVFYDINCIFLNIK